MQQETGARVSVDRATGACVVRGTAEQVVLAGMAIRDIIANAPSGPGGPGGPPSGIKPEATETIPCSGFEGRIIGKGGETIRRLQNETGARIRIEKGSGECVVTGSEAATVAAAAAVRAVMEDGDGDGGAGGTFRRRDATDDVEPPSRPPEEGEYGAGAVDDAPPKPPPMEANFGLSGALAADTNTVNGVTLVYTEPPEAKKPTVRWRLYCFKDGELQGDPLLIHRQSYYLFGRDRKVADVPTDHPSCSKQHAVIQYRGRETFDEDQGLYVTVATPYLMDLNATNGTFLNGERIEPQRYYQLLEKDAVKFGTSTREYVLLDEDSAK